MWRLSGRLAGRNKGSKKITQGGKATIPTEEDILDTYSKLGREGGILAKKK